MMAQLHKILMVEDDPDIQAVASLALEAVGGFEVVVCSGGQEALERVDDFAPDLVVLDVMMPGMDGPTVLQHLRTRAATAHLPVVFMTAKAQAHEIAAYKSLGALDVVTKPFSPMTLSNTLLAIWNRDQNERAQTAPRAAPSTCAPLFDEDAQKADVQDGDSPGASVVDAEIQDGDSHSGIQQEGAQVAKGTR